MYDIIIIGMGPAGISAAIYAKRNNAKVLVLEKENPGGLLNKINEIKNYPGFTSISGPDLAYNMFKQLKANDILYKIEQVEKIIPNQVHQVLTNKGTYKCKNVVIACGLLPKKLGLLNEDKLLGHGLSTCAICDGMFYKDQDIAIVGGGNSAFYEAIHLSKIAKNITILVRNKIKADDEVVDKVKDINNITVLNKVLVTKLNEENGQLKSITINNDYDLNIAGLFIYIGYEPNDIDIHNVLKDDNGYFKVNQNFETNIKRIYAIGSAINSGLNQIITAASQGAQVASIIAKEEK